AVNLVAVRAHHDKLDALGVEAHADHVQEAADRVTRVDGQAQRVGGLLQARQPVLVGLGRREPAAAPVEDHQRDEHQHHRPRAVQVGGGEQDAEDAVDGRASEPAQPDDRGQADHDEGGKGEQRRRQDRLEEVEGVDLAAVLEPDDQVAGEGEGDEQHGWLHPSRPRLAPVLVVGQRTGAEAEAEQQRREQDDRRHREPLVVRLTNYCHTPYQFDPYQLEPYQLEPSNWPYPLEPYQFDPYQLEPYQFDPYQLDPYQLDPYQFEPTQSTPTKPSGSHRRSCAVSRPPTTVRAGSSAWTRTLPRLRSRLPRPLERSRPWLASPAGAVNVALNASPTPAPTAIGSSEATGRAVAASACLTWSGVRVGVADSMSATDPDTIPVAIDVPLPRR